MARSPSSPSRRGRQHGFFLIPVIGIVLAITVMASVLSQSSTDAVGRVEDRVQEVRLDAIADAAVDIGVQELWSAYKLQCGEGPKSLTAFRTFLDGVGVKARAVTDTTATEFDILGNLAHNEEEWFDLLPLAAMPLNKKDQATLTGAHVHLLQVLRQDAPAVTALRVRAVVSFGTHLDRRRSSEVERLYVAGGEPFKGFDFALLANNVNCIMCHASVDSAARVYNRDPSRYGTYDRVRVGTMESLKIRSGSAQSSVAGTIYTRGPVMNKDGSLLSSLTGTSLDSRLFTKDYNLVEAGGGALTTTQFSNATGDPLPAGANLYMNYPRDNDKQPDGDFPEEFPAVVPDTNGNRVVDADEYQEVASRAKGTLRGGSKVSLPPGVDYGFAGLPVGDHAPVLSGSVQGNLVAYGTAASPLVIDGRITVDGDVVIGGVVRGSGEIIARNNTYVVGPLTYQDGVDAGGNRTFGVAQDGTENRLTLGAGGNMLVGDFLRSKGRGEGITGDDTGDFNFTMSEVTLFGQMEWIRTQPSVGASSSGGKKTKGGTGTTTVPNPVYNPTYIPRYYVVRPENPVAIFNKSSTYFDVNTLTWLGKEHLGGWSDSDLTYLPVGSAERNAAVVLSLTPWSGWLKDDQLISMWDATGASNGNNPFLLDSFLYTNNAIFLVVSKSSPFGGQAVINGGLVGADLGILVAGGLQINFDDRHEDAIRLRENQKGELVLTRGVRLR